jgi:hypothetical protein
MRYWMVSTEESGGFLSIDSYKTEMMLGGGGEGELSTAYVTYNVFNLMACQHMLDYSNDWINVFKVNSTALVICECSCTK